MSEQQTGLPRRTDPESQDYWRRVDAIAEEGKRQRAAIRWEEPKPTPVSPGDLSARIEQSSPVREAEPKLTLKLDSYYEWCMEKARANAFGCPGSEINILLAVIDSLLQQATVEVADDGYHAKAERLRAEWPGFEAKKMSYSLQKVREAEPTPAGEPTYLDAYLEGIQDAIDEGITVAQARESIQQLRNRLRRSAPVSAVEPLKALVDSIEYWRRMLSEHRVQGFACDMLEDFDTLINGKGKG